MKGIVIMNIINKITAIIGAVMISATTIGTITTNASTTLQSWTVNNVYDDTKNDTSSVRIENSSNYYVHVDISGYGNNGTVDPAYYNGQTLNVNNVSIPGNSNRRVKQFVKENGGHTVVVYFYSYSGYGYGKFSGDSPSSCNYPYAN